MRIAKPSDRLNYPSYGRKRESESDTLTPARKRIDQCGDTDEIALKIDQRTTAVARVHGRICLNISIRSVVGLAQREADNPKRDRWGKSEWRTKSQYKFPLSNISTRVQFEVRWRYRRNLQERKIRGLIAPEDRGFVWPVLT